MLVVGTPRRRGRGAAVLIAAACAASAWGCTSGRVFQQGNQAAMRGDWDVAVTCYEKAAKASPGRADYRMALDRARMTAAQGHFERARDFEKRDQLDLALAEYRRVVEFHPASQEARARVQALEQIIRDRIEASRPRPAVDLMRQQARQAMDAPALNPASREPVEIRMLNRQIQEVLDFLGSSTGINVAYDKDFPKNTVVSVNVSGITLEEALNQILTVNQAYYKVLNPRSIIIIADSQAKRTAYDEQAVQTFYLSSAEAADMEQLLTKVVAAQQTPVRPTFAANKAGNSITVRGTVPMLKMIERIIAMNDKPRAELSIDVEILEVSRTNARQHGLDLSAWQVGLAFSPETKPGTDAAPFNLNTVSAGVSTLDFYATVPSATVRFLESDSATKVIAKPNLRGSEGEKLSLKLGEELPVPSTTFYNSFGSSTGVATSPMTSFTYKNVGVNLDIEPRVTYDGEIIMKLTLEVSAQGSDRNVAGAEPPGFLDPEGGDPPAPSRRRIEPPRRAAPGGRAQVPEGIPGGNQGADPEAALLGQRQSDRPDRHRDAAHAPHRPDARDDAEGLRADLHRHAAEPRPLRSAAADSARGRGAGGRCGRAWPGTGRCVRAATAAAHGARSRHAPRDAARDHAGSGGRGRAVVTGAAGRNRATRGPARRD